MKIIKEDMYVYDAYNAFNHLFIAHSTYVAALNAANFTARVKLERQADAMLRELEASERGWRSVVTKINPA